MRGIYWQEVLATFQQGHPAYLLLAMLLLATTFLCGINLVPLSRPHDRQIKETFSRVVGCRRDLARSGDQQQTESRPAVPKGSTQAQAVLTGLLRWDARARWPTRSQRCACTTAGV